MTLSELVKLRASVQKIADVKIGQVEAAEVRDRIFSLGEHKFDSQLYHANDFIDDSLDTLKINLTQHFNKLLRDIDFAIQQESAQYASKTYSKFYTTIDDDMSNRKLPLTRVVKDEIVGRVRLLSDWHYPGLEISPHDGEFTEHLVANDPLYITDIYQEYLNITSARFHELYQSRLRPYKIEIDSNNPYFSALPKNQIGFAFCWNTFNYLPFNIVAQYINEVYGLLRPGGTFMFGFNDAASFNGAKHVEWGGMAYMTKQMLVEYATLTGYEVLYSKSIELAWHNISWLEIKKPGIQSTVKGHQTLGLIKQIKN